jgi:hypothetical protein
LSYRPETILCEVAQLIKENLLLNNKIILPKKNLPGKNDFLGYGAET